jgi:hypothetical protein
MPNFLKMAENYHITIIYVNYAHNIFDFHPATFHNTRVANVTCKDWTSRSRHSKPVESGASYPFHPLMSRNSHNIRLNHLIIQSNVQFALLRVMKAQSGSIVLLFSLTSALDGVVWSTPYPGRFIPGKETRYPLYRRLGGPVWMGSKNIAPTGFNPRTVQPVAGPYTDYANPIIQCSVKIVDYVTFSIYDRGFRFGIHMTQADVLPPFVTSGLLNLRNRATLPLKCYSQHN